MAVYAVGDIQGCYKPLRAVLNAVNFNPKTDQLWCVGDLVNRGPDSLKTLRFLKDLGDACKCVLGNHDLHLLEMVQGGSGYRRDTLDEVLEAEDCMALVAWLRSRPLLYHDTKLGWAMVHAGLHPGWSLKKAKKRARSVERVLQSKQWKAFCHQLHHQRFPLSQPPKGDWSSLIFSAAVFTRTRYCTQDGRFNWDVRTGESRCKADKAWFLHPKLAWRGSCNVVFGHWAARGLVTDQDHVLGLDSGCVWGNRLTLARLKSGGRFKIVAEASLSS